jgi:ABC-type Mn2+/Zn2+ transport system ATPase subunit
MLSKNPFEQNSVNSFQEKNRIQYLPHDLRTDWNLRLTELLILVKTNRQIRISRFTKLNTKAKVQVKRGLYIEILG